MIENEPKWIRRFNVNTLFLPLLILKGKEEDSLSYMTLVIYP